MDRLGGCGEGGERPFLMTRRLRKAGYLANVELLSFAGYLTSFTALVAINESEN